ncbi:hypothetical protein HNO51_08265 [Billgrantia sulfidoxydans]|uniref:Uncharacterized protein n=1 Tax=Billgrantia sulfidoxydans TaxID=2733484 RepID=A0ABX7W3A6_9GAMM|nr:hypothetical protein [Halomonas sulfidoxydans]QTP54678.1 hypothetical protein HNO51_08265 [Halomonas sulfidoxydans]
MNIHAQFHDDKPSSRELVERYCAATENGKFQETTTHIAKDFGIPQHRLAATVREVATLTRDDIQCIVCGAYYPVANRNDMTQNASVIKRGSDWICGRCQEDAKQQEAEELEESLWESLHDYQRIGNDVNSLPVEQSVRLLALLKHSADESLTQIHPVSHNRIDTLAASENHEIDLASSLLAARVIAISPYSPAGTVEINQEAHGHRYHPRHVAWELTTYPDAEAALIMVGGIDGPAVYRKLDERLSSTAFLEAHQDAVREIAHRAAKEEVLAYLELCLTERGLPFRVGEKTEHVLTIAMQNYSIGQVFAIIWRAARSASDYLVRSGCPKRQAANVVPGAMESFMQRALGNGWNVDPFKRPGKQAQSVLSRVVFNQILGLPDGAFSFNLPVSQIVDQQIAQRLDDAGEPNTSLDPVPSS